MTEGYIDMTHPGAIATSDPTTLSVALVSERTSKNGLHSVIVEEINTAGDTPRTCEDLACLARAEQNPDGRTRADAVSSKISARKTAATPTLFARTAAPRSIRISFARPRPCRPRRPHQPVDSRAS